MLVFRKISFRKLFVVSVLRQSFKIRPAVEHILSVSIVPGHEQKYRERSSAEWGWADLTGKGRTSILKLVDSRLTCSARNFSSSQMRYF